MSTRVVPVEATEAMLIAGALAHQQSICHDQVGPMESAWQAMLEAAPAAESPGELVQVRAERDRLDGLINNPQTDEFLGAVRSEMAHQVERWGAAADRNKSAQNWFWLVGYLAGKALRAAITGDKEKALHHCVSSAAALGNWFKAVQADTSGCGAGGDLDIAPLAEGGREGEPPYKRDLHMDGMLPAPLKVLVDPAMPDGVAAVVSNGKVLGRIPNV